MVIHSRFMARFSGPICQSHAGMFLDQIWYKQQQVLLPTCMQSHLLHSCVSILIGLSPWHSFRALEPKTEVPFGQRESQLKLASKETRSFGGRKVLLAANVRSELRLALILSNGDNN